ncbi:MAG: hypothetical protein JXR48_11370 [Candidatus Delongbacteria bacterium]|nr:hypothetical protein [Candidatus Delongbacteria bacterium]MBN2835552.1 hypothetical protein [Candidatus Delongbacteria bacterium]
MKKEVYILIGKKGSGKTYIGNLIDLQYSVKFIRVEDWANQIKRDRSINDESYISEVFHSIENGIRNVLLEYNRVIFESTGLTKYFDEMLHSLKNDFKVVTIRILSDSEKCLHRVRSRDQSIHINVSDEQVLMINNKVDEKNMFTDFEINNNDSQENLKIGIANIFDNIKY